MPPAEPHTATVPPAPGRVSWAERHWGAALAALIVTAFVLRWAYLREVAALPFFDQPVGDSAAHLKRAAEIASGAWLPSRPFYYCSIFYPYFLAAALALFHGSLFWVCAIQVAGGAALAGLIDGDEETAFREFKNAVRLDSTNVDAYLRLGDLLRKRGDIDRAFQLHRELTTRRGLDPDTEARIQQALCRDLIALSRWERAADRWQRSRRSSAGGR